MNLKEFKRSGHWPSLLCAFLYFDTSFMLWTLLGALGVFVAQAFHLSPGQKGLLVAIPLLGGALLRIVLGIATDRFGPRKVGLVGMTLTFIPLLWGWLHSTSLRDMWAIGLLLGIAGASPNLVPRGDQASSRLQTQALVGSRDENRRHDNHYPARQRVPGPGDPARGRRDGVRNMILR